MFVVHQPYFAPWMGYFAKFTYAHNFLLLNDVQFSKRQFIDRTAIVNMNSEKLFLSIPCGMNYGKKINEIAISNNDFIADIIKTIEYSYKKARYFDQEWQFIRDLFANCTDNGLSLDAIDIKIIKELNEYLDIKLNYKFSDVLPTNIDRTQRLLVASDLFHDRELLIGDGQSLVAHDMSLLKKSNMHVYVLPFYEKHPIYFQVRRQYAPFLKGLSIIDSILNIGKKNTQALLAEVKPRKLF